MVLNDVVIRIKNATKDITDPHELDEIKKELNFFIWLLYSVQSMKILTRFAYWRCCFAIFRYLTKNGYLRRDSMPVTTEVLSDLFGVVMHGLNIKNVHDDTD